MREDSPVLRRRLAIAFIAFAASFSSHAREVVADPIPVGTIWQSPDGLRSDPRIGVAEDESFILTWDTQGEDVFALRFDRLAGPGGPEFQVNTYTPGQQAVAHSAIAADGSFLIGWSSYGEQDGQGAGAFAQLYDPSRTPIGGEQQVNELTVDYQFFSDVVSTDDGNFLALWLTTSTASADGDGAGVMARKYDAASGLPLGSSFVVNTYTTGQQYSGAMARSGNEYVVLWTDTHVGGVLRVFGHRLSSAEAPVGSDFQISTAGAEDRYPDVVGDGSGGYLVTWVKNSVPNIGKDVYARRYDASDTPLGPELQLNTYTTGDQTAVSAVSLPDGTFWVGWANLHTGRYEAQRLDASGAILGPQLDLTPPGTTPGAVRLANGADGGLLQSWSGGFEVGSVFVRRFACDDAGPDADGDGIADQCDPCPGLSTIGDMDVDCVVDGSDNCVDVSNQDQLDTDGDTQGDACDPCPTALDTDGDGTQDCLDVCVNAGGQRDFESGVKLAFKLALDGFGFRGDFLLPSGFDFSTLDPNNLSFRIRVSAQDNRTIFDFVDGAHFWLTRPTTYIYHSPTGSLYDGITRVLLKDRNKRTPGLVRIKVVGRGIDIPGFSYPVTAADLPLDAEIVFGDPVAGECAEAQFAAPECAAVNSGQTLSCAY